MKFNKMNFNQFFLIYHTILNSSTNIIFFALGIGEYPPLLSLCKKTLFNSSWDRVDEKDMKIIQLYYKL